MSQLIQIGEAPGPRRRAGRERPDWLRIRYRETPELQRVRDLVADLGLHTVCQSAGCPNLPECWSRGTATFMLGGNTCTRRCGFCDVSTGRPEPLDPVEPSRVADAIRALGLRYAVITAVARENPSLVAGLRISVADDVLDASVAGRLKNLSRSVR